MRTLAFLLALTVAGSGFAAEPAPAPKKEDQARFEALKTEAEPYLTFGDQVIVLLSKGDGAAIRERMSPSAVKRNGTEKLNEFIDAQLLPYFAKFDKLDPELTVVARTEDADRHKGFVIQYVFIEKDGQTRRPLVMYVLREDDQYVVANVALGRSMDQVSRGNTTKPNAAK